MTMDYPSLTVYESRKLLHSGEVSAVELTEAALARINATDSDVKAYITVAGEQALAAAEKADERLRTGENVTPLTGIPYAVKDCLSTAGIRTTCSSKILEGYIPRYDATVISRLRQAGAVLVGKHNMDEFGMGSSCENSAYFDTHNPWDLTRVPGGSSGGTAAAVSAGTVPFALGEDTGGSIRMPAGFCGVVGLKPTYGRVSRYGLIALSSSFDSIGPVTRTVDDAALVLQTIGGQDPHDSTSRSEPLPDYHQLFTNDLKGVRLGIPQEYFGEGIEPGVLAAVQTAISTLQALGADVQEVSLPHTRYAIPVYYLVMFAEASSNLARFDSVRFGLSVPEDAADFLDKYLQTRQQGFGDEVKRRIMLGTYALSAGYYDAYYLRAQRVRSLIRHDFEQAFEKVDAIVTPVCPTTAFKIGEKIDDPLQMYLSDIHVVAANPAGVPGLALPCGFSDGMPVGLQLMAKHLDEGMLFRIGHAYQQVTDWHSRRPALNADN